jgi:hypothetical protein
MIDTPEARRATEEKAPWHQLGRSVQLVVMVHRTSLASCRNRSRSSFGSRRNRTATNKRPALLFRGIIVINVISILIVDIVSGGVIFGSSGIVITEAGVSLLAASVGRVLGSLGLDQAGSILEVAVDALDSSIDASLLLGS